MWHDCPNRKGGFMERKAVCKIDDVPVNELREFEVSPGRKIGVDPFPWTV